METSLEAALVGKKYPYYQANWKKMADKAAEGKFDTSLNFAAFFLTVLWLGYRKMYGLAAIVFAVAVVTPYILNPIFSLLGISFSSQMAAASTCGVTVGLFGNRWYKRSIEKKAQKILTATVQNPQAQDRLIKKYGGTSSLFSIWIPSVLGILAVSGVLLLSLNEDAKASFFDAYKSSCQTSCEASCFEAAKASGYSDSYIRDYCNTNCTSECGKSQ